MNEVRSAYQSLLEKSKKHALSQHCQDRRKNGEKSSLNLLYHVKKSQALRYENTKKTCKKTSKKVLRKQRKKKKIKHQRPP